MDDSKIGPFLAMLNSCLNTNGLEKSWYNAHSGEVIVPEIGLPISSTYDVGGDQWTVTTWKSLTQRWCVNVEGPDNVSSDSCDLKSRDAASQYGKAILAQYLSER